MSPCLLGLLWLLQGRRVDVPHRLSSRPHALFEYLSRPGIPAKARVAGLVDHQRSSLSKKQQLHVKESIY
jgi:hypothetical protein